MNNHTFVTVKRFYSIPIQMGKLVMSRSYKMSSRSLNLCHAKASKVMKTQETSGAF